MVKQCFHRESERRLATVMFADISGFTAMSEKMDAEDVSFMMNELYAKMETIIEKNGGTIDKFIGDCAMVLFGLPNAIENASHKALKTAIEIKKGLSLFNKEKSLNTPLDIHIGINTGMVVAGLVGGENKRDYTAMGDTVNLASRLESASKTGQILVGPATYNLTRDWFKYKYIKPIKLKGKENAVPVYELLSLNGQDSNSQNNRCKVLQSGLVGREKEMNLLETNLMKTIAGRGAIINLIGEAGIGKTRLLHEFKHLVLMTRVTLLEGKAISIGKNLRFYPFVDLLRNWAGINEDDKAELAFRKLQRLVKIICKDDIESILSFTAIFMGINLPPKYKSRIKDIGGEALEKLIIKNIRELLIKGSDNRPIVIILEDLHWADMSSIELLESLYSLVENYKILFINVFRPRYENLSDLLSSSVRKNFPKYYRELLLSPLNTDLGRLMIDNLLSVHTLPNALRMQILDRAGGNPFFIEEVIRSMIDMGAVQLNNDVFEVTQKINTFVVPQTIRDVLMARMDQLDESTRHLIRMASVIGKSFYYKIIAEVASNVEYMDQRLGYLQKMQFIAGHEKNKEIEYFFKHALARETAYESILLATRKELHFKIANTIDTVFSEKLNEFYGMLAYHYSNGDHLDKAEEYMLKAGEEALKTAASNEAIHFYREALDIYLTKYGKVANPEKIAMMKKKLALALFNRGQLKEAVYYFDRVLEYYNIKQPRSRFLQKLKYKTGLLKFFIFVHFPFITLKKSPTKKECEIINLSHLRLQALSTINSDQFFEESFPFLNMLSQFNLKSLENGAGLFSGASLSFAWQGRYFSLSRKTSKFVKDKIDRQNTKEVLNYELSELFPDLFTGRWVKPYNEDLADKSIEIGEIYLTSIYISFHCRIKIEQGLYDQALEMIEKLSVTGRQYAHDFPIALKYILYSKLLLKYGKLDEALTQSEEGIQFITRTDYRSLLFVQISFKARILDLIGDFQESEKILQHAQKIKSETSIAPQYLSYYLLSRFIHDFYTLKRSIRHGDRNTRPDIFKKPLKSGQKVLLNTKRAVSDRIEALRLLGSCHWLMGKQQKALKCWQKSIAEGERIGARLELSKTFWEVGKRLLESHSNHESLSGISAQEYMKNAETLANEMDYKIAPDMFNEVPEPYRVVDFSKDTAVAGSDIRAGRLTGQHP